MLWFTSKLLARLPAATVIDPPLSGTSSCVAAIIGMIESLSALHGVCMFCKILSSWCLVLDGKNALCFDMANLYM